VSFDGDFESAKKKVGERIKRRRERRGWSQEELAARALINRKGVSEIENGKVQAGFWTLTRIATVLDTTAPMLLRGLRWDPESDRYGRPRTDEG
jgi:transcriptional regulator with XRE-family HTH domain